MHMEGCCLSLIGGSCGKNPLFGGPPNYIQNKGPVYTTCMQMSHISELDIYAETCCNMLSQCNRIKMSKYKVHDKNLM